MGKRTQCSQRSQLALALAFAFFGAAHAQAATTTQNHGTLSTEPVDEMTLSTEPAESMTLDTEPADDATLSVEPIAEDPYEYSSRDASGREAISGRDSEMALSPVPDHAQPILEVPSQPESPVISTAFEPPPILYSTDLLPGMVLTGPGYRIDEGVQVQDYFGQFVLRSDVGELKADGAQVLKVRVRELEAVRKLDQIGSSEAFGGAVVRGVKRPIEAVRRVITQPVDTLAGLPKGVGRFIVHTARNVRDIAFDIGDGTRDAMADDDDPNVVRRSKRSKGERARRAAESGALRYLGYTKARRQIARQVGADPYSTNPMISERLDSLAWATWTGSKLTSLGLSTIGGVASDVISYSKEAYDLVWELPPEDLKERNRKVLAEIGFEGKPARDFIRNQAFTLTQQTEFVELLRRPEFAGARTPLFDLGLRAQREVHARFLIDSLRLLQASGDYGRAEATVIGSAPALRRGDGSLLVAIPVDYLHWTQEIADFAWREDLVGHGNELIVTGVLSPIARDAFAQAGWTVQESVGVDSINLMETASAENTAQTAPAEVN